MKRWLILLGVFLCVPLIIVAYFGTTYLARHWYPLNETQQQFINEYRNAETVGLKNDILAEYFGRLNTTELGGAIESVFPYCHVEAHALGKLVYEHFERNVVAAIKECSTICKHGCLHGVLTQAQVVKKERITSDTINVAVQKACVENEAIGSPSRLVSCVHGMGHAVMVSQKGDRAQSLIACDNLDDTLWRFYCASGALMEEGITQSIRRGGRWEQIPGVSAIYPCDELTSHSVVCFISYAKNILAGAGSITAMMRLCDTLDTEPQQLGCYRGAGSLLNNKDILHTPLMLRKVCESHTSSFEGQRWCIEAAVENLNGRIDGIPEPILADICAQLETHQNFCRDVGRRSGERKVQNALYIQYLLRQSQRR